ncbi:beta-ketoacyl-[acyl-carrier-protein] synthase family protein [Catellatospora bangladeshensis]|uniref:3-oxoacyl-[acyl-carrier-protein] synthase 2 n=1 Tax=Catellatospora bangladeshensis TaxID=310355 RepID=A0A8J3NK30_9ACTN|nr:beta-ketoacyl-[acyl-carrier-protein] synthase family protein [Catellatospora bangladeshensis]GIF83667.1 3-oxoacyl-[acyl-carrier-protein] synthase 2 [Catellatospora bangladeshensis]
MPASAARTATITGMGVFTPVGRDLDQFFDALCVGRSGIVNPPEGHPTFGAVDAAAIAPPIEAIEVLPPLAARVVDRFLLMALAAADDAIRDAKIEIGTDVDPYRVGVVVSTGVGGMSTYEQQSFGWQARGGNAVSPLLYPGFLPNMASARIGIKYGIRGFSSSISTACAAGAHAIAEALRLIRDDECDVVICGGSEAPFGGTGVAAFGNARALAAGWADPAHASRPFDTRRNGFVLGEGAGIVVVESAEFAQARGARRYADLIGWGATTDAYHPTMPRPDGEAAAQAMRKALRSAGLAPGDVKYVNAHGTSTKLGDQVESTAIRAAFGDSPAVSSTKGVTGHLLGAAGAIESIATVLAVERGMMPATANLEEPDPLCDVDHVVKTRIGPVGAALSNSFAFGGHNVSLVFATAGATAG